LLDRQVEAFRQPVPDKTGEFDFIYGDVQVYKPSDFLTPLAAPQARILADDLLP
jgi:hypothetical protein